MEPPSFASVFIALLPYALMFALAMGLVALVFALSLAPWFSRRWPHGLATLVASELALWLLYFPEDVRDSLASVRFFGQQFELLPIVLAIVMLVASVIPIGAKAWFAFHIAERRGWTNRAAAKAVSAVALVLATSAVVSHHANAWQGLRTTHSWVVALGGSDDAR